MEIVVAVSIPRFVLTGGPCGGKTTAREYVREKLKDYDWTPFFVPEIPTEFILNGIHPSNGFSVDYFQEAIFKEILRREGLYLDMARASGAPKKVLFCDRGIMDTLAYSDPRRFDYWIDKYGLASRMHARDGRYDAVFHLVTAACGAEEFYTLENNKARGETLDEARKKDKEILQAWNDHQHIYVIDNNADFKGKMRHLLQAVCHALGIPVPLEIERKFLIEPPRTQKIPYPLVGINIEQGYLVSGEAGVERRVRKRAQNGDAMFVETHKQRVNPRVRVEREWPISEARYLHALAYERDPTRALIRKHRYCFPYKNQYFEMDCFTEPSAGLWLLEIELTEEQQEIKLPPFIKVIKEVTDDPSFGNGELARIKK